MKVTKIKIKVVMVVGALSAVFGCGKAERVPTLGEYEARLDQYLHRQELKGGVGGDVAQIKRKMSDAFKAATDYEKRKLYDRAE